MDNLVPNIEKFIQRNSEAKFSDEYNCKLRRLFPWGQKVNTSRSLTEFGCIWVVVEPGKDVDRHSHDEEEAFIVLSGECQLEISGEYTKISEGDVVYIPRHYEHQLRNLSSSTPFVMIDIYWDLGGQSHTNL
ncbi:UNVERIFIED_CONTAM: cupin domain-containing protein [Aeromonas hydrophila]